MMFTKKILKKEPTPEASKKIKTKITKDDITVLSKEKEFWKRVIEANENSQKMKEEELKLINSVLEMAKEKFKKAK